MLHMAKPFTISNHNKNYAFVLKTLKQINENSSDMVS